MLLGFGELLFHSLGNGMVSCSCRFSPIIYPGDLPTFFSSQSLSANYQWTLPYLSGVVSGHESSVSSLLFVVLISELYHTFPESVVSEYKGSVSSLLFVVLISGLYHTFPESVVSEHKSSVSSLLFAVLSSSAENAADKCSAVEGLMCLLDIMTEDEVNRIRRASHELSWLILEPKSTVIQLLGQHQTTWISGLSLGSMTAGFVRTTLLYVSCHLTLFTKQKTSLGSCVALSWLTNRPLKPSQGPLLSHPVNSPVASPQLEPCDLIINQPEHFVFS